MKSSTPLNELRFYGVSTLEDTALRGFAVVAVGCADCWSQSLFRRTAT